MRIGYKENETICCSLCGELNFDKIKIQNIGIAIGMCGADYSFCEKCVDGKNFGKRLLELLGYPNGMYLNEENVEFREISEEV